MTSQMNKIDLDSTAVQHHLSMLQNCITRMASNSSACKTWCVTIVSAILVLSTDKDKSNFAFLACVPSIVLGLLDAYYLGLERAFRDSYNQFIDKLHSKTLGISDIYAIHPEGSVKRKAFRAIASFSVWPFYGLLLVLSLICQYPYFFKTISLLVSGGCN